jgi:putative chitinase
MNQHLFFKSVRASLFGGKLLQSQVDGMIAIINEFYKNGHKDARWLAYILATCYHETDKKMQPVKEYGGEEYLKKKKYYPWYGRDLTHTTWQENYQKVKDATGVDVIGNPELIAQMPLAAEVAVLFMVNGWYTGKGLPDYFNDEVTDPVEARRIINGKDKAKLIAGYYDLFLQALQ